MPETLFLTVNLIDRYLNLVLVGRHNLQLVGCAPQWCSSQHAGACYSAITSVCLLWVFHGQVE
jgi:hypothetical protein